MKLISENPQSTVVSRFEHKPSTRQAYQSEAQLEDVLIEQLRTQGYEYLDIHTEDELKANLRKQLERLNHLTFTDNEWSGFFHTHIANPAAGIEGKTELLQEGRTAQVVFPFDDHVYRNIKLLDKRNIHENHLQVIHQYTPTDGKRANRYDVTILVNGLPMVHIELKKRGVAIREAFNQIYRYKSESFSADSGLFDYVQLFVISNGTHTKYYSNTTRRQAITENNRNKQFKHLTPSLRSNDSFEFTSYWADRENNIISDIEDFTATFFAKHTLLNILTKYCVFTVQKKLLVMRPYQISATEAILQKIYVSTNQRQVGSMKAGGYIWHTTGSGKTLTSFKTAQLCTRLDYVDKVLFVVDRKDLDYQTICEYEKFKKGCVSQNKTTTELREQLENDHAPIVITTIQKLNTFCKSQHHHSIYNKHVVIIFDECHRSQFGDMHSRIVKRFGKYHIFGFTGTPIFPENATGSIGDGVVKTTAQVFGDCLHIYTVVNAIADENVLPFRMEYIRTMRAADHITDEQVQDINRESALLDPKRIEEIVRYVLEHYDRKTKRNEVDSLTNKRYKGFNSIFATASIDAAKRYYSEFRRQQDCLPEGERLKIGLIYSFGVNDEVGMCDEDSDSTEALSQTDRDFLDAAIKDYNGYFSTNFDTSSLKFPNYYKDVSQRMKQRELDMLIVVNMFLTGFDATTLNTLWVDKNLRQHGLMQAYSRTNRILDRVKQFGNIVCFRDLEEETNKAIALFADDDPKAHGVVLMKTYEEYLHGYDDAGDRGEKGEHHPGFEELVNTLKENFPLDEYGVAVSSGGSPKWLGEKAEKDFIRLFGTYLRLKNILDTFDRFEDDKKQYISRFTEQDYTSVYLDLRDKYRPQHEGEVVNVNDDLVFEIELIKQVEINVDYIISLIEKHRADRGDDTTLEVQISKAIGASPALRNKKELIEAFVRQYIPSKNITDQWIAFVSKQARQQLEDIIAAEHLKHDEAVEFMRHSFQIGEVETLGERITKCLPPIPYFGAGNQRSETKQRVLDIMIDYFDRFYDIYEFE